jgi:hypothetical protein
MRHYERSKRALYWTAVSLIVCEGLPLEQAARRMGIDDEQLKDILHRRRTVRLDLTAGARIDTNPGDVHASGVRSALH